MANNFYVYKFLSFIALDIEKNQQAISSDLVDRVQSLVAEVDFDLDEKITEEF